MARNYAQDIKGMGPMGVLSLGLLFLVGMIVYFAWKIFFGKSDEQKTEEAHAQNAANEVVAGAPNVGHSTRDQAYWDMLADEWYTRFYNAPSNFLKGKFVTYDQVVNLCKNFANYYDWLAFSSSFGSRDCAVLGGPATYRGQLSVYCDDRTNYFFGYYIDAISKFR